MVEALVPYVYQDELYELLGGSMPSLTLGALLLRLRRMETLRSRMTAAQTELFEQVEARHVAVRQEWQVHYDKKLAREAESRLGNLHTYFKECDDDPRLCANAYLPEALRRTIIQEILDALPDDLISEIGLDAKIKKADARMRRYLRASVFVWDPELKPVYPEDIYWWLYNRPP